MPRSLYLSLAIAAAFVLCVPGANWAIANIGTTCIPDGPCLLPVGFGLDAPSGSLLFIGPSLVLRDLVHELEGRGWVVVCILIGAALAFTVAPPALAIASASAYLLAEAFDFFVYDRLRRSGRPRAVLASGAVGAVVDSIVFLWLAFGSLALLAGIVVAKLYASVIAAGVLWAIGRRPALAPL